MRLRTTASALIALLFLSLVPPDRAEAFPATKGDCSWGEEITWYFAVGTGGPFDTDEKPPIRDGIDDWLDVLAGSGASVITSIDETSSGDIPVMKEDDLGLAGNTYCRTGEPEGPFLQLSNELHSLERFKDTAAHEMGHHLEMWHTGAYDHFGGSEPSYMGICEEVFSGQALSQDDNGHASHHWGAANNPGIHANAGFEAGTLYWGTSSATSYTSTADPYNGSKSLRWRPSASGGYVYQTMNLVDAGGRAIDARTAYKKVSTAATTGYVKLQILRERINYASTYPGSCENGQFQAGPTVDQNFREDLYGFIQIRSQKFTPTTSWKLGTEINPNTFSSSWEGFNIRVRVTSDVTYVSNSDFALLDIDATRVRDRG